MRNELSTLFNEDPFFSNPFSLFNSIHKEAEARMEELMNDPNTKVYKSPDGTTTVCYSSSLNNLLPTRTKKQVVAYDYPTTNVWETEDGDFEAEIFIPGYDENQVYMDYKDGYLNIFATKAGPWKDVLKLASDGKTYELPDETEDEKNTKEIKKVTYIQKQSKDNKIDKQRILFDMTKYDISKLERTLDKGILRIHVPAREEAKPKVLTFND